MCWLWMTSFAASVSSAVIFFCCGFAALIHTHTQWPAKMQKRTKDTVEKECSSRLCRDSAWLLFFFFYFTVLLLCGWLQRATECRWQTATTNKRTTNEKKTEKTKWKKYRELYVKRLKNPVAWTRSAWRRTKKKKKKRNQMQSRARAEPLSAAAIATKQLNWNCHG